MIFVEKRKFQTRIKECTLKGVMQVNKLFYLIFLNCRITLLPYLVSFFCYISLFLLLIFILCGHLYLLVIFTNWSKAHSWLGKCTFDSERNYIFMTGVAWSTLQSLRERISLILQWIVKLTWSGSLTKNLLWALVRLLSSCYGVEIRFTRVFKNAHLYLFIFLSSVYIFYLLIYFIYMPSLFPKYICLRSFPQHGCCHSNGCRVNTRRIHWGVRWINFWW